MTYHNPRPIDYLFTDMSVEDDTTLYEEWHEMDLDDERCMEDQVFAMWMWCPCGCRERMADHKED